MDPQKIFDIALQLSKLADSLVKEFQVELQPKTAEKVKEMVAARICLTCNREFKENEKIVRGVHANCKLQMFKRYKEEELLAAGWILPPNPGGAPSKLKDKLLPGEVPNSDSVSQRKTKRKNKNR